MADPKAVRHRHRDPMEMDIEVTTPQGTQANGVEHGHDASDINIRVTMNWFIGVFGGLIATFILINVVFHGLLGYEVKHDVLPSRMYAIPQIPPVPRLIPSPFDTKKMPLYVPLPHPGDVHDEEVKSEDDKLKQAGMMDEANVQRIPGRVLDQLKKEGVLTDGPEANADTSPSMMNGLEEKMPSAASGGLKTENSLR